MQWDSFDDLSDLLASLKQQGRFVDAKNHLQAYLNQFPDSEVALQELGHVSRLIGEFADAESAYAKVWELAEGHEDDFLALDAILGLASVHRAQGNYTSALGLLDEADELASQLDDHESMPHIAWVRGTTLRYSGFLDAAAAELHRGLHLANAADDREGAGYLLAALGGISRVRGDYVATGEFYRQAYDVFQETEDAFGLAYTACGNGNAARMQANWELAETFFQEAAQRYQQFGDKVSYAYTLWAWGTLAKMNDNLPLAEERFAQADALFSETGDGRGHAYVQLGRLELRVLRSGVDIPSDLIAEVSAFSEKCRQHHLSLEAAFADLLLALATSTDVTNCNQRLADLGTQWQATSLPLNLP